MKEEKKFKYLKLTEKEIDYIKTTLYDRIIKAKIDNDKDIEQSLRDTYQSVLASLEYQINE